MNMIKIYCPDIRALTFEIETWETWGIEKGISRNGTHPNSEGNFGFLAMPFQSDNLLR